MDAFFSSPPFEMSWWQPDVKNLGSQNGREGLTHHLTLHKETQPRTAQASVRYMPALQSALSMAKLDNQIPLHSIGSSTVAVAALASHWLHDPRR
jgi:hypothetical protein